MPTATFNFNTPGNYTYDNTKIEVTGGVARLRSNRTANDTFYASYKTTINGTVGNGTLTGTASGGASILSSWLDLAHNDNRYVDYDADLNADSQQVGCIEFDYRPNYSGAPVGANMTPFTICKTDNDLINMITMYHFNATGMIVFQVADQNGVLQINQNVGVWNPVNGTTYHFSINYDFTTGATRIFIDGTQFGATMVTTLTRSSDIALLRIGSNYLDSYNANFYLKELRIFDAVQHTSNYTPSTFRLYAIDNPTITINETILTDGITSSTETSTISGSDNIKYVWKKGILGYYISGAIWTLSTDLTDYTQSSTNSDNNTNASSFTTVQILLGIIIFLHSTNGDTTPEIDLFSIDYNYAGETADTINTCIVWGYSKDPDDSVDTTAITAQLNKNTVQYKDNITVVNEIISNTPDSNTGYWELELIETANMSSTDDKYVFRINNKEYERSVPNETTKNFWELT